VRRRSIRKGSQEVLGIRIEQSNRQKKMDGHRISMIVQKLITTGVMETTYKDKYRAEKEDDMN